MLYNLKHLSHGYPWAFPAKAPTTSPTSAVSIIKTATTSQTTATSSTIVASNPQQSAYSFNPMYYVYGPMLPHPKPIHYGYPWAFPAKTPPTASSTTTSTTKIATTTHTTATTFTTMAGNPNSSACPFKQFYYAFSPMVHHHKSISHGYPWSKGIFPVKVPLQLKLLQQQKLQQLPQHPPCWLITLHSLCILFIRLSLWTYAVQS